MTVTDSIGAVKKKLRGRRDKVVDPCKLLMVTAAIAMETSTAVEAAAASVEAPGSASAKAAAKATAALAVVATSAVIPTATVVAIAPSIIAAAIEAVSVAVEPGAGADEDAADEPVRPVVSVGGTGVGIIAIVAISADRGRAVIGWDANSDAERDALGLRTGSREETNGEKNAE